MRTEQEMMALILRVAKSDNRIRAVSLEGSRANPAVPKDQYQDYDITYYVEDIAPFYNAPAWVVEKFGQPLIVQMPETMRYPEGDGNFNYMMIYPDGNRLDLSFKLPKNVGEDMPSIALLDKDGFLSDLPVPSDSVWHITPPTLLFYYSCCNNFWWCLNNVAKGIARYELPYVMTMLNTAVRSELHDMINWYIGALYGFNLSTGKDGKYISRYLSPDLYAQYAATYSGSDYNDVWTAVRIMCDLFHTLALLVAAHFGFNYHQHEEDGIRKYLAMVRAQVFDIEFIAPPVL